MSDVGDYLWANYYTRIKPMPGYKPDRKVLDESLHRFKDRLVVIRNKGKIKGVAVYLNISDQTFRDLEMLDISTEDVVRSLASQHGPNAHFILACGGGYATIRMGVEELKRRKLHKTISWWSPDLKKLHKYTIKE